MQQYRTTSHSKTDLKVHVVWVPKYRKRILRGEVGLYVRDILRRICTELDVEIISGKVAVDHIHLFVSYPPHISISTLMQKVKGKSSYKTLNQFSHLRKTYWGRHLWARGYFAISSGNITDEMVQAYIEQQVGEDIQHGPVDLG